MTSKSKIAYRIENDPFRIIFLRDSIDILSLSTSYKVTDIREIESILKVICDQAILNIIFHNDSLTLRWEGENVKNCFLMEGYWYGLGELVHQHLLLNQLMLPLSELIISDLGDTGLSNIMTPAWLNDKGVLLLVYTPIQVGINQPPKNLPVHQKRFIGNEIPFKYLPRLDTGGLGDRNLTLIGNDMNVVVYFKDDVIAAHKALVNEVGFPKETPPLSLFSAPVWTTWAQYKDKINQDKVLDFAHDIVTNGFPYHVLEIDDRWQSQYGDLEFDLERFPDAKGMIDELHTMGFKVTTWVMPFIHKRAIAAEEAVVKGYVVRNENGLPYPVKWWQGQAYLLDVTNSDAMSWFAERLHKLQDTVGLDGFKFDGGEARYLPPDAVLHQPIKSRNEYSNYYVKWVSEHFSFCEARTGWFNQISPILFRLWDLWSTWAYANGLRSIIPKTLSLSLTGYPYTFPDMIGGNGYFIFPENRFINSFITNFILPIMERGKRSSLEDEDVSISASDVPSFIQKMPIFGWPTAELMIRWTQLNALMPVMQFSIKPWDFGDRCAEICRKYAQLHLEFTPLFERLAQEVTQAGEPIIRPVFWLAPYDQRALVCDDQFLVGEHLLVAPVVYKGKRVRNIYLPPGTWQDYWNSELFEGPIVLERYPAPLDMLPIFIKKNE
jgi:hypothetical protein